MMGSVSEREQEGRESIPDRSVLRVVGVEGFSENWEKRVELGRGWTGISLTKPARPLIFSRPVELKRKCFSRFSCFCSPC
jgi:hypothetical protein